MITAINLLLKLEKMYNILSICIIYIQRQFALMRIKVTHYHASKCKKGEHCFSHNYNTSHEFCNSFGVFPHG